MERKRGQGGVLSLRRKLLDASGAELSLYHEQCQNTAFERARLYYSIATQSPSNKAGRNINAEFEPQWKEQLLQSGEVKRCKDSGLSLSEVMTLIIAFHRSNYRTFKHFYTDYVLKHWRGAFPGLVSYTRRVELRPSALIPLCSYFHTR